MEPYSEVSVRPLSRSGIEVAAQDERVSFRIVGGRMASLGGARDDVRKVGNPPRAGRAGPTPPRRHSPRVAPKVHVVEPDLLSLHNQAARVTVGGRVLAGHPAPSDVGTDGLLHLVEPLPHKDRLRDGHRSCGVEGHAQ